MQLPPDHIFYSASADIAEIVRPLNKLGITYFTFGRHYHDGSRLYLKDRCDALDEYLKEKHYLNGNTECKPENYKEQVMLWSTAPNQRVFDACARAYGFDHGIFVFEPHDNYCETIAFATNSSNDRIINTYLSKMDQLKAFIEYFREMAAPIIRQAEKQKFILPFNETLDISSALIDTSQYNALKINSCCDELLTERQIECCLLLLQGKTAREIGASLKLSTRTVEYYLNIIKTKLDCKNKAELLLKLARLMK